MDVKNFLTEICELDEEIADDCELLDSGILDSFALIELVNALEDEGVILHLTRIDYECLRTPASIEKLIEDLKNNN